jgi:hypothetical protein
MSQHDATAYGKGDDMTQSGDKIRNIAGKWSDVLLVCRKCSKKLGGGFGKKHKTALDKVLKGAFKGKGAPKVLAVPCLDICPKHAVCLIRASVPTRVHLVEAGTPVEAVIAALG